MEKAIGNRTHFKNANKAKLQTAKPSVPGEEVEFVVKSHSEDERQDDDNLEIGLHNHEVEDLVKEANESDDDWRTIKWTQAPHFVRDQYHRRNFVKRSLNYQRSRRTSLKRISEYKVIQKKHDLEDDIWVTEDLIWEDREAKKKLKEVMTGEFKNGKKPRFARGKLYIDVPLRDHITPHYANLGLIKLPDIVKLNT
ncbi:unnamed protein product [Porites evermanni]|uniref:Uncharacterized protein n=1 Tax=Porites evermanni TaxID=104178 RepID=A0ABN8S6N3_9CNID|nr:unnamed protein product [Porites evermanni]